MDYFKKSRIEEVLIAILGKGTVTSKLISRIEKILDAIRVKGSYDGMAMSEVEEILICIFLGKRFEKPTHSRIAAMLKVKANGGEYTELRKSRVEELIYEWLDEAKEAITYTGTLPATLTGTTDGYLASYKIYGNDGAENVNLVPSEYDGEIWFLGGFLRNNGTLDTTSSDAKDSIYTDYMPIDTTNLYYIFRFHNLTTYSSWSRCCIYDANKEFIAQFGGYTTSDILIRLQNYPDAAYIRLSAYISDNMVFLPGDTIPDVVSPYGSNPDGVGVETANGYMLPMITSDGTTTTETDIYIGDTALEKGEYVDSESGKIYRFNDNAALIPIDPPVPLPQIPTYDGTTTVSYDGEPEPEKVELTYYVDS